MFNKISFDKAFNQVTFIKYDSKIKATSSVGHTKAVKIGKKNYIFLKITLNI